MRDQIQGIVVAGALGVSVPALAETTLIDFSEFENGEIIPLDAFAADGLTLTVDNPNQTFDLLAAFDTAVPSLADPDLVIPFETGNAAGLEPGIVLIISETDEGSVPGFVETPDDQAGSPAGTISFAFAVPAISFGFTALDLESGEADGSVLSFFAGGLLVGEVVLDSLTESDSPFFDPTLDFGGESANTITPFSASAFGVSGFDRVEFEVGGSAAFDAFVFETIVPVPGPAAAGLLGLAGVAAGRRRR